MLDDIAQQIVDWLTTRTGEDYRRYVFLLLAAWIAYRLTRWLICRFAPWLLARVVFPLIAAAAVIVCVLVLAGQTLLALLFRAARMRPPGPVFGAGDVATAGARRAVLAVPLWAARAAFLYRVPRIVILVILVTVCWWGHEIVCGENPDSRWCGRPAAAVNAVGDDVWDRTVTAFRDVFSL
jgi:hypothetical protein